MVLRAFLMGVVLDTPLGCGEMGVVRHFNGERFKWAWSNGCGWAF